jgi:hypothetical protein
MRGNVFFALWLGAAGLAVGCGRTGLDGPPVVGAAGSGGASHAGGTEGWSSAQGRDGQGGKMGGFGGVVAQGGQGGWGGSLNPGGPGTGGGGGLGGRGTGGTTGSATGTGLFVLASGQPRPTALAVDDTNVYWSNFGGPARASIMKVPVSGGSPTLVSGASSPAGIAVYGGNLYWAGMNPSGTAGSVFTTPVAGGPVTELATGFMNDPIAIGPTGVYGTGPVDAGVTIVSVGLAGGTGSEVVPAGVLQQSFASYGIALDATSVYWTSFADPCVVMKAPLAGGTPTVLAKVSGSGSAIAVDESRVYWITSASVYSLPTAGGDPTVLAPSGGTGLAIDASNVYFTNHGFPGIVAKVPLAGGAVKVLASGQTGPAAVAVDATSVYWINDGDVEGNGAIVKLTPK